MCTVHTHGEGENRERERERKRRGGVGDEMGVGEEISATDRCATHARTQTHTGGSKKTKKKMEKKKKKKGTFSSSSSFEAFSLRGMDGSSHIPSLNYCCCWALCVFVDFSHPLVSAPLCHSSRRFAQIESQANEIGRTFQADIESPVIVRRII